MKKLALVCIFATVLSSVAVASDIAFYVGTPNPGWYETPDMLADVETIITNAGPLFKDIQQFDDTALDALGAWVDANTDDGELDIIWLNGCTPSVLYPTANASPDGSRIETWLDNGNMVINVGDWFGYVSYETGARGAESGGNGAANILDLASGIIVSADGTMLPVTDEGQQYLPSLGSGQVETDRPVDLGQVVAPWEVAAVFAGTATRADPVVIRNTETGGYLVIINQASGGAAGWIDDRGLTCAEFLLNWANEFAGLSDPEQAKDPSPEDDEIDVLRNVTLSWLPGTSAVSHDVYFGDNFDDVNAATVSNPLGVLLSQGQAGTTIAVPETLEFATTYYWRVDENGPTLVKGAVWSFTTELLAYPIQNIVATSNATSQAGRGPERLVDGSGMNENDQHSTDTADMWDGTPHPTDPTYVQFDFDGVYKLHELVVWNYNMQFEAFLGIGVKEATIEITENGTDWTSLGDFQLEQGPGSATYEANTTISLGGVAAQALRMTINSSYMSTDMHGLSEVRILSIPVQPSRPQPADAATDVAIDATLSWRTGREAVSHEVYLGTDPAVLDMIGTSAQSSYTPTLDLDTTYSWQIVEVNEAEAIASWAGPVWTFTTQEYLVVDDFESYIDDETAGDVIWEIWIDGLVEFGGDAANGGSQVGHNTSPFAEQSIVHGGSQSMPLYFDNANASAISEADMALSPAQNWSGNGIKTLSLWFCGTTGNTGQLYVKINETKVTYDGPAASIGVPGWQKWNIVLAETGANLSNVSSLSIGVEGAGSGLVYIDDIRLHTKEVFAAHTSDLSIAISAQANWWSQAAADREIEEIVDNAQAPVAVFGTGEQAGLAQWVSDHTNNGVANLLILCGQLPDTIYEPGNVQVDDSLVEQFLDAGNTVINTGDWIFYVVNSAGTNGAAGLQTIMDIPGVTVAGGDDTPVTVTAEGQTLTPSLQDFATDRPFHLDTLEGDWSTELVLAQNADGTLADPVIVRNAVTGGRIGVFHQAASEDNLPRGEVMSEWINNWYLDAAN